MLTIKVKNGVFTAIDRVQLGVAQTICNEINNWSMDADERIEFQDILHQYTTPVQGSWEMDDRNNLPLLVRDLLDQWGEELGFI